MNPRVEAVKKQSLGQMTGQRGRDSPEVVRRRLSSHQHSSTNESAGRATTPTLTTAVSHSLMSSPPRTSTTHSVHFKTPDASDKKAEDKDNGSERDSDSSSSDSEEDDEEHVVFKEGCVERLLDMAFFPIPYRVQRIIATALDKLQLEQILTLKVAAVLCVGGGHSNVSLHPPHIHAPLRYIMFPSSSLGCPGTQLFFDLSILRRVFPWGRDNYRLSDETKRARIDSYIQILLEVWVGNHSFAACQPALSLVASLCRCSASSSVRCKSCTLQQDEKPQ